MKAIENFKKSMCVKDFFKSLSNALFLVNLDNDTSRRQAFVLLDNLIERFLKNYLIKVIGIKEKTLKKNGKIYFDNLIKAMKNQVQNCSEIFDRILENHESRNILYHSPIYHSVSKDQFFNYFNDINLICREIGLDNISFQCDLEQDKIHAITFKKDIEIRKKLISKMENLIKKEFKVISEIYEGDIFLASVPKNVFGAIDTLENFLQGSLNRTDQNKIKVRILEVIESKNNFEYHSFLVSYIDSSTWLCFYKVFSYKRNQKIRCDRSIISNIINENIENIDYQVCSDNETLYGIFDPVYTRERISKKLIEKDYFTKTN